MQCHQRLGDREAKAGAVFGEDAWIGAAEDVFRFVVENMSENDKTGGKTGGKMTGRLHHTWCAGEGRHPAVLDDYANMALAALVLHGVTGQADYLGRAQGWVQIADNHYWDVDNGGYFLGADDTGDVIARSKPVHDNAVPAGNGVMAGVHARLFYLTGKVAQQARADATIAAFSGELERSFSALSTLLNSNELLHRAVQIVVFGSRADAGTESLLGVIHRACLPNRVLQLCDPGAETDASHPAAAKGPVDGKATAYVCRGPTCSLPITDPAELGRALAG